MFDIYLSSQQAAALLAKIDHAFASPTADRAKLNETFDAVRGAITAWAGGARPSPLVVESVMSDIRDLRAADLRHVRLREQLSIIAAGDHSGRVAIEDKLALGLFPPIAGPMHQARATSCN